MRERDPSVKSFGERFQVHIRGVHMVVDIVKRFPRDVAVGDHDGADSGFPRGVANIDHVLAPDRRLVISKCDGRAAVANRQRNNIFRRNVRRPDLVGFRF